MMRVEELLDSCPQDAFQSVAAAAYTLSERRGRGADVDKSRRLRPSRVTRPEVLSPATSRGVNRMSFAQWDEGLTKNS